jgi:tripartite-type tricarboxylate transporter receptor subunit TctC
MPGLLPGLTPIALVSHQSTNIKTLKDLADYFKANPNVLNYSSCGVGTPWHFVIELGKQKLGENLSGPALSRCRAMVLTCRG